MAFSSTSASAAPNDAEALEVAREAITVDYLATKFSAAETKLMRALSLCPGRACSDRVKAQIHRDLGVVYVAGLGDFDKGKAQFTEAIAIDPKVALDEDLETEEIRAAFDAAAESLGVDAAPSTRPRADRSDAGDEEPEPRRSSSAGTDDLVHQPPREQLVSTPVPIYAEPKEGVRFSKVKVRYKPWGGDSWKSLELSKVKRGFGVELPCLDTGAAGELRYYLQAYDDGGDVESFSGSRDAPHIVDIVNELEGDPPHLPGSAPPARCAVATDCPPEFPGCGDASVEDSGPLEPKKAGRAANWISLAFQQDVLLLAATNDVCDEGSDYQCFDSNDQFYDGIPDADARGEISGGPSVATSRILVGYDRLLGKNIGLGARGGFALRGGPDAPGGASFLPVHLEARGSYWFGTDPFAGPGFRPFVDLSAGMAQVDTKVETIVFDRDFPEQPDQPRTFQAWRKTGTVFASVGGGMALSWQDRQELFLGVRVMQMFVESGTAIAGNLGYALGL